ncbi:MULTISPECIES: hypothetical protein [unclassified Mycolicibacterium]|uniref:hypothetical protein n=1 Tax=unclassified Mycolicibacterium TaxID=2636767 RepID=UPI001EE49F1D|nr:MULTISPECIES: hypothetical protein [unclassified Mycolicibacterium]
MAIALAVVVTVLVVRPDSSGDGPSTLGTNGPASEFASANDTGPVNIITDEPTCDAWNTILGKYSEAMDSVKWDDRDAAIPASAWTPEQRSMYESAEKAMTQAADQAVNLVKKTPHRVVRVLFEQFIAYTRAFVQRIPSYVSEDANIIGASNGAGDALANMCGAISYRSAQAIAPLVSAVPGPTKVALPEDPNTPTKLLTEPTSVCSEWEPQVTKFADDTQAWRSIDKGIPAKEWTPDQRAVHDAVAPIMLASADEMERLGRQSGNPRFEDVATLAAQYRRAFVLTLPDYKSADSYLALSATNLVRLVNLACKAA